MRSPALEACPRAAVLAMGILGSMLMLPAAAAAADDGWPMAGRDPAHSASAQGAEPPYRVVWDREVGAGGPVAGVAATSDIVAVVTRHGVLALDAIAGAVLWERGRSPGPSGVPAIANNLVIHARASGLSSQLVARGARSGDIVWQATLGSAAPGGPTVAEETAFVGTTGGEVVALDLATGEERWRFETLGRVAGAPAVAEGIVVVAAYQASSGRSTIYAVDAASGGEEGPLWQYSPGAVGPPSAPSVSEGRVYVGTSDLNVRAIDLEDGKEIWAARSRDGFGPRQVPAAGEALIVADRTHAYRLDAEKGTEAWAYLLADLTPLGEGRVETLLAASPAISGQTVLLGSADGLLSAIDIDSGHRIWRQDLGAGAIGPVAVGSKFIYATTFGEEGRVVALWHDPDGELVDEISPTVLFPGRAVRNFAAAVAAVGAAILLLFRVALRPRSEERA